jgi:pyruvate kinase
VTRRRGTAGAAAEARPLTRIVATLGPAVEDPRRLRAIVEAGASVLRLNFSHGSFEQHASHLARVRAVEAELGLALAVLGDLRGPRIRLGPVAGGEVEVAAGELVEFVAASRRRSGAGVPQLTCTYGGFLRDLRRGHRVLVADGTIRLRVESLSPARARCRVEVGGTLREGRGINLPDSALSAPTMGAFDRRALRWSIEHGLDFVALSFVRSGGEMRRLRRLAATMAASGQTPRLVAKIERPEAVASEAALREIVAESDAVMVARGDLGAEMGLEAVPPLQRRILAAAHDLGRPAIVATEVLASMVAAATPTRAEVGDLSRAVLDEADAIMLSGETAIGADPPLVVRTAASILRRAERWAEESPLPSPPTPGNATATSAIAHAAWHLARDLRAGLVVVSAEETDLVRHLGQGGFIVPIAAVGPPGGALRRLLLFRGVMPVPGPRDASGEAVLAAVRRHRDAVGIGDRPSPWVLVGAVAGGGVRAVDPSPRRGGTR